MILDNTDWLSSIPKHWEVKRLKDVSSLNPSYDGADLEGDVSFVPMEALRYDDIQRQTIPFDEAKGSYTFFGDGDVLVAKVTPCFENGNIAVATDLFQGVGFGSSEIFTVRANTGICSRFLFYFMRTADFMDKACSTMCGVGGLKRISPEFMRSASVVVPPINEQEKIVSYLDEKIAAINATIAARNEELKLLKKFKQSKIAEVVTHGLTPNVPTKSSPLGQISTHWEVKRVKDVVSEMFMGTSPDYEYEEENTNYVFGQRNNQLGYIDFSGIKYAKQSFFDERPDFEFLRYGDVLLNTLGGGSVGRAGYYNFDDGKKVITDGHIMVIRSNTYNTKYMYYYLLSQKAFLENLAIGSTNQAFFNISDIRVISLPCPPIEEQSEIAHYLGNECEKIDRKCKLIDEQIKKMQLLKRALINEVVTGKRQLA